MTQPTPQPTVPSIEDLAAQQGGGVAAPTGGMVWLGQYSTATALPGMPAVQPSRLQQPGLGYGKVPAMVTKDQAVAAYYSLTPNEKQTLISVAVKFGAKPEQINDASLSALWERYVLSAQGYQQSGKMLTPWSVMFMDIVSQENAKKTAQEAEPPKGPTTTTSTQANLSTRLDAQGILYTASRTLLGRDPTNEEANRFWQTLNEAERAQPSTTTTTTTYGPEGEAVSQEQATSGGISAEGRQMLAVEEAKQNPEYGAYQAATTYMDALRDMIYGRGY